MVEFIRTIVEPMAPGFGRNLRKNLDGCSLNGKLPPVTISWEVFIFPQLPFFQVYR
jgi:hypothetical protein